MAIIGITDAINVTEPAFFQNYKDVKEFLSEYAEFLRRESAMKKEIEAINEHIASIRDVQAAQMTVGRGGLRSDVTFAKAEKIVDTYEVEIAALLDEISEIQFRRKRVNKLLSLLEPEERAVIRARYLEDTKWDFVPAKTHLSRSQCFKLHDRAIMKMLNYS